MNIEEALDRLRRAGARENELALLEKGLREGAKHPSTRLDLARLSEDLGLIDLAFRALLFAAREKPDDPEILHRLAGYHMEQGDLERARRLLEKCLAQEPLRFEALSDLVAALHGLNRYEEAEKAVERALAQGLDETKARRLSRKTTAVSEVDAPAEEAECDLPSDGDVIRFLTLFQGREDVHARQWWNPSRNVGGYSPVREPLTPKTVRSHIIGDVTLGVYPIRLDGTASFMALDMDIRTDFIEAARHDPERAASLRELLVSETERIREELLALQLDPVIESSGYKGRHFWIFLEEPQPCHEAHALVSRFARLQEVSLPSELRLECFPKQPRRTGKGLGNLIKIPLGIHRRTGRRSEFLNRFGEPVKDSFQLLREVTLVSTETFRAVLSILTERARDIPRADDASQGGKKDGEVPEGPPPAPPAAPWSEADFETCAEVAYLLDRCPVLAMIRKRATETRRLSRDEQIVLTHSLGHLPQGVRAVNYLFERCPGIERESYLKSPLSGNPISCPKIRKKVPHITSEVDCSCEFPFAPDRYPSPVLHMMSFDEGKEGKKKPASESRAVSPEGLARRYGCLKRMAKDLSEQINRASADMAALLKTKPDHTLPCEGGYYILLEKDGTEEIAWRSQDQVISEKRNEREADEDSDRHRTGSESLQERR